MAYLFALLLSVSIVSAADVSGVVVDQDARPIPRVLVTLTDAAGEELARAFTGNDGTFSLQVPATGGCFLEAKLTGFHPTRTDCGGGKPMRVVLAIASVDQVVIVSATRTDTPAGQVASAATVFLTEDIERRQRPMLGDLLRSSPGATVVSGAPGAVSSLFVRGGESNYTKVLLDGIPLNEPGGTFDLSNMSTEHLGRVELVRGAHSSVFGSDAVAGVLQLFTRRARPGEPKLDGMVEGGNYGTLRGAITFSNAAHIWDYSVHASRIDTAAETGNSDFRNTTLSGSAGVTPKPGMALRFVTRGQMSKAGNPGQTSFGRPDLDAFFERQDVAAGTSFSHQLSSALHQTATYSYSSSNQVSSNLVVDPPYRPRFGSRSAPFDFFDFLYDSDNDLARHHLGYQVDWRLPSSGTGGTHVVTIAGDWDAERATLQDRLASTVANAARNNLGATIQHQGLWPRVFITAGLRLENNDSFGFAAAPRASLAFIARESDGQFGTTKLKIAAGAGIKEPTILQSFSPSPVFPGNPDLEAERSRTFDIGVEQTVLSGAATVELTWFANRFRDIISTRTVSFNPFRLEFFNVGETRARGLEIAGQLSRRAAPLHLRAGYTLLDSEIIESAAADNPVFGIGQPLFRRPRHSAFLETGTAWRGLDVTLFGTFIGRSADSDFASLEPPFLEKDGHSRWDLRAAYPISSRLKATAAVDNLRDRAYMEPLGYPSRGRAMRVGLHVTY